MKIEFHKILSDGRTVRFAKKREGEKTLQLSLIIHRPPKAPDAPAK